MLRIEQSQLAERARVSLETIKRIERRPGAISALAGTLDAIQKALESAGVDFIADNGDGPGVRLRKVKPGSIAVEDLNASNDE
jgi:transcriptional regulator with XRE-family HTH domain